MKQKTLALLLSALGIPLGLLLGYGVGALAVPIALIVALVVLYRRSKGGGQPRQEKPKEPEFKGPVYTVDYEEVDEDKDGTD